MKSIRHLLFGLASLVTACALSAAPVDSLERNFRRPPDSAKPHTWWHWMNGNITREGITADLEAMKHVGIGGAQIFNVDSGIPHGPVQFLSPEWRALFQHAVREANRLGLELCVHNCAGWSSSGGPWNTPEHAMQRVVSSQLRVSGPAPFAGTLPAPPVNRGFYRDIAVLAFPSRAAGTNHVAARSDTVDLTARLQADGRLEWNVPNGDWVILRFGYTPTGQNNHPAPREATGLECDKFSRQALDLHWAGFMKIILDDVGPLAGKTLNNALIDSYEVRDQNWTPAFREEFRRRRGYDLLLFLPAMTGNVVDSREMTDRFLWDLRRTIADLFAENYYGHFAELCRQRGLLASIEPYTGPFESLQCGAPADIVMGEFWSASQGHPSIKLAASVAHIYGKTIVGAESFTARPESGRWLNDPYSIKALGDLMFCQGLNRYIFHRYAMQPWTNRWPGMTMGQWGFHFERTVTWWEQSRAWLAYVARCQFLLQQGRAVADVAYFCGESAPVELRAGNPATPAGYDWDGINADVLLHRASVKNGRLTLPDGTSYAALVLPPNDPEMTPGLLKRLSQLVRDGATIVGMPPHRSPGLENYPQCDAEVKSLAAQLWGRQSVRFTPPVGGSSSPGAWPMTGENSLGKGRVVWGKSLGDVLGALNVKPDFEFTSASPVTRLAYVHRVAGETDLYLVSNQRTSPDTVECTFRVRGRRPELWNPDSGEVGPAPVWREQDGRTTVRLTFDPAGSVFVVFRAEARSDHLVSIERIGLPDTTDRPKPPELRILKAVYGAFPDGGQGWMDVTAQVKSLYAAGTRRIPANNEMAGDDPAPNIVKRLRVEYLLGGRQQMAEVVEGRPLTLPADSTVLKATYGDFPGGGKGPPWLDVTAAVKLLVARGARQIPVSNEMAGDDPAPNVPKQLRVEYRLAGQLHTVETNEGDSLELPAQAEVQSARYGQLHAPAAARDQTFVDLAEKLSARIRQAELIVLVDNNLAGGDPAWLSPKELRVDYSLDGLVKHTTVAEGEMLVLPETAQLAGPPPFGFATAADESTWLRLWTPGTFALTWASNRRTELKYPSIPAPLELAGSWEVRFPPGWNAPARITFDRLLSWPEHSDPGIRYFSGTATYEKEIEIPADRVGIGRELWLDLGAVKNFAEISLNGRDLGTLWKPPFRVNATTAARPGTNRLVIKITNLWPNRLIGDEQLPADCEWEGKRLRAFPDWLLAGKPSPTGRLTFTTWHHWTKDSRLLESGLIGPVTLRSAALIPAE